MNAQSRPPDPANTLQHYDNLPLSFEANEGQADNRVKSSHPGSDTLFF
jgi:hypothetical protein